jgi:predicted phosphodiesterase
MHRSRLRVAFALALLAALDARAQALTKLPMLHSYRADELRVQWETDSNPPGTVHALDWGTSSVTQNSVVAIETLAVAADRFVHRARATGLDPGGAYVYRVRSGANASAVYPFRTADVADAPFRMAWIADNQDQAGTPFVGVLNGIAPHAPDVIGHAGDTVQNGDVLAEWQTQWFDPFAAAGNLGQRTPVLVARGSHDGFYPPAQIYHWLAGNNRWYAETIGRVRFVFLDSTVISLEQNAFLDAELASPASQQADFRVVVFHHPPYSNLWSDPGYNGHPYQRSAWVPLFEEHGVDLVINGHAHCYERAVKSGVVYLVVGGAGGRLDTVASGTPWPFFVVARGVHHYAILDVEPGHLSWTAYTLDGAILDRFELGGAAPEISVFPTSAAQR